MRSMASVLVALALVAACPAGADEGPGAWEELAFLPWGDGPAEVGLTLAFEDELQRGPHGIAAGPGERVAVIDRVAGRALVLDANGLVEREVDIPGRPGPAAMLPDGSLAIADEGDPRRVRLVGGLDGELFSPRWALPASRLVAWQDGLGRPVVEGIDAFTLQLPLTPFVAAPQALQRGVPAADGHGEVWVVREHGDTVVVFPETEVVLDPALWPAAGEGFVPGAGDVLAVTDGGAAVVLESLSPGEGPLEVARAVVLVDDGGAVSPPLALPPVGPVAIPADLAVTPDGAVLVLVSEEDGCRLLRAELGEEVLR